MWSNTPNLIVPSPAVVGDVHSQVATQAPPDFGLASQGCGARTRLATAPMIADGLLSGRVLNPLIIRQTLVKVERLARFLLRSQSDYRLDRWPVELHGLQEHEQQFRPVAC